MSGAYERVLEEIPGLTFTFSADGTTEFVSRRLLEYLGRPLAEIRAWAFNDTMHPDDIDRITREWRARTAAGRTYAIEHRLRRADGIYRWVQINVAPRLDATGGVIGWCGILFDIDEVKRSEEGSGLNHDATSLLIDCVPGLLYTMTSGCDLEFVNRQLLEYVGRTVEQLRAEGLLGRVHPDDQTRVAESFRRAVRFGAPPEAEQRLRRFDGEYRWFKPRVSPIRGAEGQVVRWYVLLSGIEQPRQGSQLEAARELAASIAHELNQPLAALVANAHACREWLSATPPVIDRAISTAERIVRNGNTAAEVVARIRSLFRQTPPVKEFLSLNDVVSDVCSALQDDLRHKHITLQLELQNELPRVAADRIQMRQLVINLARNAIEAMDGVRARPRELSIRTRATQGEVLVRVDDCGTGLIHPDAIFEPFYTTKPNGMGMGLAICRSIIDAHGGRLWATPNEPHGTAFHFVLPATHTNLR